MKKHLLLVAYIVVFITLTMPHAYAYNNGDIVNKTVYSDIIASINDYNIASYNVDGYTAVVAEDLVNYGFIVNWVASERALYISRNVGNNIVSSTYIAPKTPQSKLGTKADNILYSDIKTYINGNLVTSYNIGGRTVIYFNDLAVFGKITYSDATRRIDLEITDGLNFKISPPVKDSLLPSGLYFEKNSADGLQVRWTAYNNSNKTINYYTTTYYMFNSVGDFAYDRFGKNYFTIKVVGPVYNGESILNFTGKYKAEVYDVPCTHILLNTITLEYSDGTSETIYYNHMGTRTF